MEISLLWAEVAFTAQNGDTEGFLTDAAQNGIHLTQIVPVSGGVRARCSAGKYRSLASLARKKHVCLRLEKRAGIFFALRPYFRRKGLRVGFLVFIPLLFWMQNMIWAIDGSALSAGQQARAAVVLWENDLIPGSIVTQAKLSAGEYALMQSGEFSWASLNFSAGRLVVEAAKENPAPDIAAGTLHGIRAKVSGTVTTANLRSGTMLVTVGQEVVAGQGLIGTARAERDGTLIFQPASGEIRAQFEWEFSWDEPLAPTVARPHRALLSRFRFFFRGHCFSLPKLIKLFGSTTNVTRHFQPDAFGLPLPFSVEETVVYSTQQETIFRTEEQALALARMESRAALYAAFPDAEILARKEDHTTDGTLLHYRVCYTVQADICTENK